jgi:hypothetical protein
LICRALQIAGATSAGIFRVIDLVQPTLLIDEAETFLGNNSALRGVLNSGHRKGTGILRTVSDGKGFEPRIFSAHSPTVIAMIGKLPATLAGRSIHVQLRRALTDEKLERFRSDRASDLERFKQRIIRWARDNAEKIAATDPEMGALFNRRADNWRPLYAIAEVAGGDWPKKVRESAASLENTGADDEQSPGVQLLADLCNLFKEPGAHRIPTANLISSLVQLEGRPWPEYRRSKPITPPQLAELLRPFNIYPRDIRLNSGSVRKGYYLSDLSDAFNRYLPET